jgi:DnaJ-class molecular chaperone
MEFKDYYATLGVTQDATEKEIKQSLPQAGPEVPSRREPG